METSLPCCVLPSEHLVKVLAGSTAIHWDSAPILAVCPCSKGICSALLGCTRQTTSSCSTRGSLPLAQHFWSHAWRSLFSPGSSLRRDVDVLERVEARARDGEGSGAALLWVKAEKAGTVQPAGEKAWGDFYFLIYVETNYHKGGCNEGGAGLFSVVSRGTTRETVGTEQNPEGSFWTSQTTYLLWGCRWRSWTLHPWSYSKATWLWVTLRGQWGLDRVTSGGSFQP